MSSGFAFLDKITAMAKLSAVTLDDAASQSLKATAKASGIVIDDTATTPQYVTGLSPARELPIIARIAKGSAVNKAILVSGILLLSYALSFTGWPILHILTPLLMAGGAFLAFEGYEKMHEMIVHHEVAPNVPVVETPVAAEIEEANRIKGAIRTDVILSAEIMTLTFSSVATSAFITQATVLIFTGIIMTVGVYGAVALLVKMDDIGLAMARSRHTLLHPFGRGLVKAMPKVFGALAIAGALAMLWVGGGIVINGTYYFGWAAPEHILEVASHAVGAYAGGLGAWLTKAALSGVIGAVIGWIVVLGLHAYQKHFPKKTAA